MQIRGVILVALSGVLFGWMGFFGTRLFEYNLSIENMLFWRFAVAAVWIMTVSSRGRSVPRDLLLKSSEYLSRRSLAEKRARDDSFIRDGRQSLSLKVFILSAIAYSGASAFYFMASKQIGTGLAMVIFYSFPVFVALIAWLLGTWKMNLIAFIALFAVISGMVLMEGRGEHTTGNTGIFLGVIAAVFFAAYVYGSKFTTKKYDSLLLTLSVCIGNMIIFFIWSTYTNTFEIPTSLGAWFYILAIGVVATALPIQFLLDGLKYLSPVKASVLSALEPAVTLLVGFGLLDESITMIQLIGVLVVLSGAILIQFERKQGMDSYGS